MAKVVKYTSEHFLFLWKHFRHVNDIEFSSSYGVEEYSARKNAVCVEIRDGSQLVAVGIAEDGNFDLAAVKDGWTGLQKSLIRTRLSFYQKKDYEYVSVCVRASNYKSFKNLLDCGFKVVSSFRYANDDLGFELRFTY